VVGIAVSMAVLALGLAVFRSIYLNAVPAAVLPYDAAASCTTPSSGSCGPGCTRCWCWRWWWPLRGS
jgi:hypothetical protein